MLKPYLDRHEKSIDVMLASLMTNLHVFSRRLGKKGMVLIHQAVVQTLEQGQLLAQQVKESSSSTEVLEIAEDSNSDDFVNLSLYSTSFSSTSSSSITDSSDTQVKKLVSMISDLEESKKSLILEAKKDNSSGRLERIADLDKLIKQSNDLLLDLQSKSHRKSSTGQQQNIFSRFLGKKNQ